ELDLRHLELEVVRREISAAKVNADSLALRVNLASKAFLEASKAQASRLEEEARVAEARANGLREQAASADADAQVRERLLAEAETFEVESLANRARAAAGRIKARGEDLAERLRRERLAYALFRDALLSSHTHIQRRRQLILNERRKEEALDDL